MFTLNKFSLIITTRCNLRCRLCCEYVPQNKPFVDMTVDEGQRILDAFFAVCDHVNTLHLTGGGEPFLHPHLAEMIRMAARYTAHFDRLMLFTNSTISIKPELLDAIVQNKDKILVQLSHYGIHPEREKENTNLLLDSGVNCKIEKYYGEDQSFGGWVDFGGWESCDRTEGELERMFHACSVTNVLRGNWRTRDGKVHWCSRSQRGMELGLIPDRPEDYIDLLDSSSVEEKREKFTQIANARFISACDHCTGDAGTIDSDKRYKAAEQMNP